MPKETENEETRPFHHTFIICGISIGVGGRPPPLATPMIVTPMLFVILRFCVFFLLVYPCVHVEAMLMVLFCIIILNM